MAMAARALRAHGACGHCARPRWFPSTRLATSVATMQPLSSLWHLSGSPHPPLGGGPFCAVDRPWSSVHPAASAGWPLPHRRSITPGLLKRGGTVPNFGHGGRFRASTQPRLRRGDLARVPCGPLTEPSGSYGRRPAWTNDAVGSPHRRAGHLWEPPPPRSAASLPRYHGVSWRRPLFLASRADLAPPQPKGGPYGLYVP